MGKLNLLKANYTGKVGQTVGAKWKDLSTVRTYAVPADPNTAAQQKVRGNFKALTAFVALFSDAIRYKSALDTSSMSVRNAIIKLNKDLINATTIDFEDLSISKGGLQSPSLTAATYTSASGEVQFTFAAPTATNFTGAAKAVCVFVHPEAKVADVTEVEVTSGTATITTQTGLTGTAYAYLYFLDKRGSSKVGSQSVSKKITIA